MLKSLAKKEGCWASECALVDKYRLDAGGLLPHGQLLVAEASHCGNNDDVGFSQHHGLSGATTLAFFQDVGKPEAQKDVVYIIVRGGPPRGAGANLDVCVKWLGGFERLANAVYGERLVSIEGESLGLVASEHTDLDILGTNLAEGCGSGQLVHLDVQSFEPLDDLLLGERRGYDRIWPQ